jgi:hypothetical protein
MKFISTFLGSVALLFAAVQADTTRQDAGDDCSSGPFHTGVSWVGGNDGGPFCATRWKQGVVMTGIEAWANKNTLRAVQFKFSDGSLSEVFGKAEGDRNGRLEWQSTEAHVEKITLWGNGVGTRTGRIYVRLSNGKELDVGKDTSGQTPYDQTIDPDITGGILIGAFGKRGDDINHLGFLFLGSKVRKIKIEEITLDDDLDNLNARQAGITTQVLAEDHYTNKKNASNDTHGFWNSLEKEDVVVHTQTTSTTFGTNINIEYSGQVAGLGPKVSFGVEFKLEKGWSDESRKSTKRTLQWRTESVVPPGKSITCKAFAQLGEFDGTYTSKVCQVLCTFREYI